MTLEQRLIALAGAVRDKINAMMPRLLPAGGTAGQVLTKSSAANYAAGWQDAAGGGGGSLNFAHAQVDFGAGDGAAAVDVAAPWAAAGTRFIVQHRPPQTPDHDAEDAVLEGLTACVTAVDPGVGVTLMAAAPSGTWGRYDFTIFGS